jgi:hypothetical protein
MVAERRAMREKFIALARTGILDAKALSERVVAETKAMKSL